MLETDRDSMLNQISIWLLEEEMHKPNSPECSKWWDIHHSSLFNWCLHNCCCCWVAKSCPALLSPYGLQYTRLLCPSKFPSKITGVSCHFLLQGIFSTQELNLHLLHWQVGSLPVSHQGHQGNISCKDGLNKGQKWYGPNRSRRH